MMLPLQLWACAYPPFVNGSSWSGCIPRVASFWALHRRGRSSGFRCLIRWQDGQRFYQRNISWRGLTVTIDPLQRTLFKEVNVIDVEVGRIVPERDVLVECDRIAVVATS